MEQIVIHSTLVQIEELKDSIIWADIVREMEAWKEGFEAERSSLTEWVASENPSTAAVLMRLGDINGRMKAVDYMLGILDIFLHIKQEEKEENDERQE